MSEGKINILIVNYNTKKLTNACVDSVLKTTPNCNIYVFDNSDTEKYQNDKVTIFDNTNHMIVDFDDVLNRHKNKTAYGAESSFGSLKHALSVDKCFDLLNDNFILLDSDVLVKKDLHEIWDEEYIYVGHESINGKSKKIRVSPHVCFINVKKAKKNGIRYFDENRIVGFNEETDDYDTGSSFYFDCLKYKSKKINENDYIVHFGAGSWARKNREDAWLSKNKHLWDNTNDRVNLTIFINTHKPFEQKVFSPVYQVINSKEINPDLPLKDDFYSELYQYKYVADNIPLKKYIGFCHYRRYFNFLDDIPDIDGIFKESDAIVAKPIVYRSSVKQQYANCHNIEDLYIIGGIIADKYPEDVKMWHSFINGKIFLPYNMFIMRREDFKNYIVYVNTILDEYLKIVGTDIRKRIENNKDLYLKKFYPNNTVDYQYRIGGYIAERLTNLFILSRFKKLKAYPVIVTEDKYRKNEKTDQD